MISVENLYNLKRCYFHSGCPDGIASREIIKAVLPNVTEFIPFHFGKKLDLDTVDLNDTLFVDIHPNFDQIDEIFERFENVCIADHHKTSEPVFEHLDLLGYGSQLMRSEDTSDSGAMLAWKIGAMTGSGSHELWEYAKLVSISDTWQTQHPEFEKARRFAQFVQIFGDSWEGCTLDPKILDMMRFNGPYHRALMAQNEAMADHAIIREVNGFKIAFIGGERVSDAAEILRNRGCDVIVGYKILTLPGKGEVISYSTRSNPKRFVVRVMAEVYGGGGHDAAAGFSVPYDNIDPIIKWQNLYLEMQHGIAETPSETRS